MSAPSKALTRRAEAADWFARLLSPSVDDADFLAFEQWCSQDQANADAYADIADDHAMARLCKDDPLIAAATRKARIGHARPVGRAFRFRRVAALAAAAMLVAAVGVALWQSQPQVTMLATSVGEQREVVLADGTHVMLDTDTHLEERFDRAARTLVLVHGRVDIDVGTDSRPFSVLSGRGTVRDIGTHFQVERYHDNVAVTLMSGQISVSLTGTNDPSQQTTLHPGQRARFGATGGLETSEIAAGVEDPSDWTRGVLVFEQRRLEDLLVELNRYSTVRMHVTDPSLANLRITGVFHVGDREAFLKALQTGWSIGYRQTDAGNIELVRL